jgi:hypothetical protein
LFVSIITTFFSTPHTHTPSHSNNSFSSTDLSLFSFLGFFILSLFQFYYCKL